MALSVHLCVQILNCRQQLTQERVNVLPFVLHTGHQQSEQVEGEEDPQAEQHSHHVHLRCGEKGGPFGRVPADRRGPGVAAVQDSQLIAGETMTSRTLVRLPASIRASGRRG